MTLTEFIRTIDILEYTSQYTEFEKRGREYFGLSPLKEEKTPSFSVDQEKQVFYDFSSGAGGNVVDFVMAMNNCGKSKAVQILRDYAGYADQFSKPQQIEAAEIARRFKKKKETQREKKYEVLPDSHMDKFVFAEDKLKVWEDEGISMTSMKKFGVAYDELSNRIVYPIRNISGQIINVSGRALDEDWKEKGLRKYTYFRPLGVLDTMFGLSENMDDIKRCHEIILFEGAKSVMKADSWGIQNSAAILTSHLNPHQFKILVQLGCAVTFALDSDVDIF